MSVSRVRISPSPNFLRSRRQGAGAHQFAPNVQDPSLNGGSFTYAKTATVTSTGNPRTTSAATEAVTISAGASFKGQGNLIDVHQVSRPIKPGTGPSVGTLDSYLKYVAVGGMTQLLEAGSLQLDRAGGSSNTNSVTYNPGHIVDELPQTRLILEPAFGLHQHRRAYRPTRNDIQPAGDKCGRIVYQRIKTSHRVRPPTLFAFDTDVHPNGTYSEKDGQAGQLQNGDVFNVLTTYKTGVPTNASGAEVIPAANRL